VPPTNWHATLAFLGSVPDEEQPDLVAALERIGQKLPPSIASVGPSTSAIGVRILHVPVAGLDGLANAVRVATMPFNRSADRHQPFLGHLTLARTRRGEQIPRNLIGVPLTLIWPVREFRLVSSTSGRDGTRYSPVAQVKLEGLRPDPPYEHVFGVQ
jgi:RNA 2',3'-cyclic 3'-phosphodiesterase